ncbi:MAG TPA: hypothetical protein VK919_14875 [Solirubrobacterales bacterium]|nr:hypothetical protein [Solirubrobacterales bacterium]
MIGHIGGIPAEELLASLAGAGAALAVVRGWLAVRLRQFPHHGPGYKPAQVRSPDKEDGICTSGSERSC